MIRFALYGIFGWCAEIVWTAGYDLAASFGAGRKLDPSLAGHTYLWMFPIYGGGCLVFEIAHAALASWPWMLRGLAYMLGCFTIEYASGWLIKGLAGAIPWDYSGNRWHIHGLIRLDYAPVWFAFGLLLEHVERLVRAAEPALRAAL